MSFVSDLLAAIVAPSDRESALSAELDRVYQERNAALDALCSLLTVIDPKAHRTHEQQLVVRRAREICK
jgi:hypothetical protein